MKTLAKILIALGVASLAFGIYLSFQRVSASRIAFSSFSTPTNHIAVSSKAVPARFIINRLQIDLPVIGAKIDNGNWEVTDKGVSYLVDSPIPGEWGNSILYGHNWKSLLGNLTRAVPGDEILISYSDESQKRFEVDYVQIVSPDQTHILAPTDDIRITIYTCTGFLDSKRFVVVATLRIN